MKLKRALSIAKGKDNGEDKRGGKIMDLIIKLPLSFCFKVSHTHGNP